MIILNLGSNSLFFFQNIKSFSKSRPTAKPQNVMRNLKNGQAVKIPLYSTHTALVNLMCFIVNTSQQVMPLNYAFSPDQIINTERETSIELVTYSVCEQNLLYPLSYSLPMFNYLKER